MMNEWDQAIDATPIARDATSVERELASVSGAVARRGHALDWRSPDVVAIAILLALCAAAALLRAIQDDWLIGYDTFSFFIPSYGYLGERLREGNIPAWNPYFTGGAPMAGDPGGGWMYLPIMLAFTLFNVIAAFKVLLFLLASIGGLGLYGFARRIGLSQLPALLASVTFAIGPIAYGTATDRIVLVLTYPLIALGLLAAEMALRATWLVTFLSWTALGGLALSQNFAAWPTQGALYTLMYAGGWLGYRWLFAPIPEVGSRLAHLQRSVAFGLGMGVVAVAFGGAVLWPALDYTNQSPLAGGDYSNAWDAAPGGTSPMLNHLAILLQDSPYFRLSTTSGAIVLLALLAVTLWRNRYGIPCFALVGWLFIDLASTESLTMRLFYLVPMFERIHSHRPSAASAFIYPAILLAAAGGFQLLLDGVRPRRLLLALGAACGLFAAFIGLCWSREIPIGGWPIGTAIAAALLVPLVALPVALPWREPERRSRLVRPLAVALLVLVPLVYPTVVDYTRIARGTGHTPGLEGPNLTAATMESAVNTTVREGAPGTAAEFLQRQQSLQQPFRYASYYGADTEDGRHAPSVYRRVEPEIVAALANSRSGFLQLEQVSGYNPIHLSVYVEYFVAMQGGPQNYHFTDIFARDLEDVPLFNMLNVRYVVVPLSLYRTPGIAYYGKEVFRDLHVIVYENPNALPRAWIVHDVRPAMDGQELTLLNTRQVDGRTTAFVEGPVPEAAVPSGGGPGDEVTITSYEPERIEVSAKSRSAGLLVLSEVYANGWTATVDGDPVGVFRTNHALRGVPLAAGEHEVVLRYEPRPLRIGLWSTGLASVAILGVWGWALRDWRKRG